MVTGIHEPLVSWDMFTTVQALLNKRRKSYKSITKGEEFILKGSLLCPVCGKLITGSASKGNGGVYPYYHCQRKYGCKQAFKAERAHQAMIEYLSRFKVEEEELALYRMILEDVFNTNDVAREEEKRRLESDIKNIKSKIGDLDELLLYQSLPIERYNRLVKTLEDQESEMVLKLGNLSQVKSEFAKYLDYGLSFLANVNDYYEKASPMTKKRIIGSIFPEKLVFDGKQYRTNKINEVFALICSPRAGFRKKMPGKKLGSLLRLPFRT